MPMKTTQTAAMLTHRDNLESSGDGSDFGFTDDEDEGEDDTYGEDDEDDDDYYPEYYDEYDEFSGSGDGGESSAAIEASLASDVSSHTC